MTETASATGELSVKAKGKTYRLHFGMSTIADLQAKHGEKAEAILTGKNEGLPDMNVVIDIFLAALQRYHSADADKWVVDDIVAENHDLLPKLMQAAFPDAPNEGGGEGNAKAA